MKTPPNTPQPRRVTRPNCEKQTLLGGLRVGEVAEIAGISEATIQNWQKFGFLPTPPIRGKWRHYTAAQTEDVIYMAALVKAVGVRPSRAAAMLRQPGKTLEELGIGELSPAILRYTEDAIIRARRLHANRALEEERARTETRMRHAQRAIAELPSETAKIALLQDMVQSLVPEAAVEVLLFAIDSLGDAAKVDLQRRFLRINPKPPAELAKPPKKDLKMIGSFASTQISRGEHDTAGICVKGLTLLISEGIGGLAYAAEFPETDAQKLLGEMNNALSEVEGFSQTSIFSFGERKSPIIGVVVERPLALSISAGPEGAIVAQLTTEDFTTIRDALRASLAAVANPIEIVAEPLPENDPRREITLQ